jgi:hypothetical protein
MSRDPPGRLASMPVLTFEGSAGEFAERFCRAAEGKPLEIVAAAVYRLQFETDGALYVRKRAAQLVRNHCVRLGMDEFAAQALMQAIDEIGLNGVP